MAGTKEGAKKARNTNLERYGKDFYKKIGSIGGKASHTGGFYANPELASKAGRIGGAKSRRGPSAKNKRKPILGEETLD